MKKTVNKSFTIRDLVRISDLRNVVGGEAKVRGYDPAGKKEIVGTSG